MGGPVHSRKTAAGNPAALAIPAAVAIELKVAAAIPRKVPPVPMVRAMVPAISPTTAMIVPIVFKALDVNNSNRVLEI